MCVTVIPGTMKSHIFQKKEEVSLKRYVSSLGHLPFLSNEVD